MKKPSSSLKPVIRIINSIPIRFYSLQQIEEAVPVEIRLPKSKEVMFYTRNTEHKTSNHNIYDNH
jgi:hypothetical protein